MSRLPAGLLRALPVEASVDPRSIQRTFDGQPVKGLAGERAQAAVDRARADGRLPVAASAPPAEARH